MSRSQGIPGIAVGTASVASLLIYAGFRGINPLEALREISTGKPSGLADQTAAHEALYTGVDVSGGTAGDGSGSGVAQASLNGISLTGPHPEFVTAAGRFANDKYSQAKRWQDGYSDCSSFPGKALAACGISPPGASTTASYLTWKKLKPIAKTEIGAGDFLVSSGHMALAINNTTAVGQQNKRDNVKVGPISQIMWGQSWVALRYTGPAGKVSAGSAQT